MNNNVGEGLGVFLVVAAICMLALTTWWVVTHS